MPRYATPSRYITPVRTSRHVSSPYSSGSGFMRSLAAQASRSLSTRSGRSLLNSVARKAAKNVRRRLFPTPKSVPETETVRTAIVNQTTPTVRNAVATRRRPVKRNKRKLKVSRKFAKRVKQVIDSDQMFGNHTITSYQVIAADQENGQGVYTLDGDRYWTMFDPLAVMNVASSLWKGKAQVKRPEYDVNTDFDLRNLHVNVVNSYCRYQFKNNTRRVIKLTLYECLCKNRYFQNDDHTPNRWWAKALNTDSTNGIILDFGQVNLLGRTPGETSTFANLWKSHKRDVILEPGQIFTHVVQGPKNTEYKFEKFWGGVTEFQNLQPGKTMGLMAVVSTDMAATTANAVGRWQARPEEGNLILVQRDDHFTLSIPEQAGFKFPAAPTTGTNVALNLRKPSKIRLVYTLGAPPASGGIRRIDEINPITTQTI